MKHIVDNVNKLELTFKTIDLAGRESIEMTLEEHIDDIRNQLKQGAFADEAAVSNGIVNRLLHTLDWPIFTPQVVIPEFGVEGQRVDFALCHPTSTPRVFIEVKRVGNIDKGIKQLFEYAFHIGVTIVILTDGQKWRFYHPAGEGSYEDRMVEELDIIVRNSEECAKSFNRYLNYKTVLTGKAAEVIVEDYKSIVKQRKVEERLPEVWSELIHEKNENLLQIVMEKAREKVGHEPTEEQVVSFLKNLSVPSVELTSVPIIVHEKPKQDKKKLTFKPHIPKNGKREEVHEKPKQDKKKLTFKRLRVTLSDGEVIERNNGLTTFIEVIEKLGIERVKDLNLIRNTIPLISTSKDPTHEQHQIGEFYIVKRMSTKNKKRILDRIAKELKVDLEVELVDKA